MDLENFRGLSLWSLKLLSPERGSSAGHVYTEGHDLTGGTFSAAVVVRTCHQVVGHNTRHSQASTRSVLTHAVARPVLQGHNITLISFAHR